MTEDEFENRIKQAVLLIVLPIIYAFIKAYV